MRVTARLVRVSDQQPSWAGQFDEKADAFFLVQDTIAQQVAGSLALSLSLGEKSALAKRYTESADAYHLYVTGRYHWNKRNTDGIVQAESYFRRAIEKDPTFALAYLGLADTLSMAPVGFQSEAEYAIERAIELDDKLGEAYASRGFWRTVRAWQWDEAEADFKQALELNPGYGTAHQWYATLLAIRGRVEQAKAEMQRALEIDPTSHNFLADMGQMHYFAREYDEAESYCLKALEIYPDFLFAHCNLREIYLKKGEDDKAFDAELKVDEALRPSPGYSKVSEILAGAQAGARETYRRLGLNGILRKRVRNAFSDYSRLFDYAVLGERDRALEALERSYETHEFLLPFVNVDPLFDDLRSEPRFQAVFRRMGLAR
jgi:tetratricopeptide (TPR) repeat protein